MNLSFLFSSEFGRLFFVIGTVVVLTLVRYGYFKNIFFPKLSKCTVIILVTYIILFLFYRFQTGHMSEHMVHEPWYIVLAIHHGMISLLAIVLTCYVFLKAIASLKYNQNYFQDHKILTLILTLSWPWALLSGFLI